MEYKKLFEPLEINGCVIPNRLAVPAMVVSLCTEEGYATERYIKYHEEKAKGEKYRGMLETVTARLEALQK